MTDVSILVSLNVLLQTFQIPLSYIVELKAFDPWRKKSYIFLSFLVTKSVLDDNS